MKVGIMQPYFFPYIGYWQLMNEVDQYVVYDDVNYKKGGWINRNRILVNKAPQYFNLKIWGASPNKLINELEIDDNPSYTGKLLKTIEQNYRKAPFFDEPMALVEAVVKNPQKNLGLFLFDQMNLVSEHLSMNTKIILSSTLEKDCSLRAEKKVFEICRLLGADTYYNSIGGITLYSGEAFRERGMALKFLEAENIVYKQFGEEFHSNLSIVDVLMFNGKDETKRLLDRFKIIEG